MEFSRPEYWSGQSFPSSGDLRNPGIEPRPPAWQADSLPAEPQGRTTLNWHQTPGGLLDEVTVLCIQKNKPRTTGQNQEQRAKPSK